MATDLTSSDGPLLCKTITLVSADVLERIKLPKWAKLVEVFCNDSSEAAAPFQISHTGTDGAAPTAGATIRYTAGQVFTLQFPTSNPGDGYIYVAGDSSNSVFQIKCEG